MALADGFVYLSDVDPSIIQVMSYATGANFIGTKIDGYLKACAICTIQAAKALQEVQLRLRLGGFSLVVYDAYRPQKAVDHFIRWSQDANDLKMRDMYYPSITNKRQLFDLGYISAKSSHSRGSALDVSIIKLGDVYRVNPKVKQRKTGGRILPYLDDGTLDMYTSFDLFDQASMHDTTLIPKQNLAWRQYLRVAMQNAGFLDYQKEWWHYTLDKEPFKDTYFNFDVY